MYVGEVQESYIYVASLSHLHQFSIRLERHREHRNNVRLQVREVHLFAAVQAVNCRRCVRNIPSNKERNTGGKLLERNGAPLIDVNRGEDAFQHLRRRVALLGVRDCVDALDKSVEGELPVRVRARAQLRNEDVDTNRTYGRYLRRMATV